MDELLTARAADVEPAVLAEVFEGDMVGRDGDVW